jgi:hypothetical protein
MELGQLEQYQRTVLRYKVGLDAVRYCKWCSCNKQSIPVVSKSNEECSMSIKIPSNPAVFAIMGSSTLRTSLTERVYATSSRSIFSLTKRIGQSYLSHLDNYLLAIDSVGGLARMVCVLSNEDENVFKPMGVSAKALKIQVHIRNYLHASSEGIELVQPS